MKKNYADTQIFSFAHISDDFITLGSINRCYTCGDDQVDPVSDGETYCDLTKDADSCGSDDAIKMYNHTCDIMDDLGASEAWVRGCPAGVQSCFWSQGRFGDQGESESQRDYKRERAV